MSTPTQQRDSLLKAAQVLLTKSEFTREDSARYSALLAMVELLDRQPVGEGGQR